MRRFSQRNSLVTLNEINITPLLDLAFVLLIIFIITTPLLEQGLDLRLPDGGKADKPFEKSDIKTVDISSQGKYVLSMRPMALAQLERELVEMHRVNPRMIVFIRCDKSTPYEHVAALLDVLETRGIKDFSLRTSPRNR
jgi:biopolymer transport protein ExbD/biopolymer transport protein TolR